jgi:hypothetical protein
LVYSELTSGLKARFKIMCWVDSTSSMEAGFFSSPAHRAPLHPQGLLKVTLGKEGLVADDLQGGAVGGDAAVVEDDGAAAGVEVVGCDDLFVMGIGGAVALLH